MQLAGVRLVELADGRVRGVRAAEVYTGLRLPLRGAPRPGSSTSAPRSTPGRPLAWLHPALGSPFLREPQRHRLAAHASGGGLVTTCGLDHFGPPDPEGEGYSLHGRASHLPAENVRAEAGVARGRLRARGGGRDAPVPPLRREPAPRAHRSATRLGATSLAIEDRWRRGLPARAPRGAHHCNLGCPSVEPDSELLVTDARECPRDDAAGAAGLADHRRLGPPRPDSPRGRSSTSPPPDAGAWRRRDRQPRARLGAAVRWRGAELPVLAHWKMTGEGEYVCEPRASDPR